MKRTYREIRVKDGDRDAWLAVRKKGVGGSDVAAIMGLSPYRSPYEVWAEKSGICEPADISDKPSVIWGNILEPVVGGHYKSLHPDRKVKRLNAVCQSIERPWAQASLDYEVKDPELGSGILEIKTADARMSPHWENGVPVYYQTQITHYMSVLDRPFADVAVLIGGNDYREYRIYRDEDDIKAVNEAVDAFWHRVETGEAPDMSGTKGESEMLFRQHQIANGYVEDYGADPKQLLDFIWAKQKRDEAEKEYRTASDRLKQLIGDDKGLESNVGKVTWVRTERTRLDTKRLREERPDVYEEYLTTVMSDMGLRFTKRKES